MNTRSVLLSLLIVPLFLACSGSRELQNTPDIDASWQGVWQGQAILENSLEAPKFIQLRIDFTSTNIRAFYSDTTSDVRNVRVSRLKLEGDQIDFTVVYETRHDLASRIRFTGRRVGNSLMVEFHGRRGGRPFNGIWQARYYGEPPRLLTESEMNESGG